MTGTGWNPWKLTAIVMALATATALITGVVVARWSGTDAQRRVGAPPTTAQPAPAPAAQPQRVSSTPPPAGRRQPVTPQPTPAGSRDPVAVPPAPVARSPQPVSTVPTQAAIDACNHYAAAQVGQRDKTTEVVKDAVIGAVAGAAIGAAGGAIADGGKGAGKGAAIGGVLGAGAGSLYGLNENKKHDQAYRDAYGACMRSRGYSG